MGGGGPVTLFLRDDDVGAWTPAFATFIEIFRSRQLPVSYQIIPALLTDDCAARMRALHEEEPHLFEFGQHGFEHGMTIGGKRLTWEFGEERSEFEQEAVIAEGAAILRKHLHHHFSGKVFTPPRHRFNGATVRALHRQGYAILSAAAYADPARRFAYAALRKLGIGTIGNRSVTAHPHLRPEAPIREISISVAVDNGAPVVRTVDSVLAEIARARRQTGLLGLMFHHQAWNGEVGRQFLVDLADALLELPDASFSLIGEIP